jgi:hypothetical protein
VNLILNFVVFTAIALVIGLGTAWHMVDQGSALTTLRHGPWTAWYAAGDPNADPYTKARVARSGRLPIVATTAMEFVARADAEGEPLVSECHYRVRVPEVPALWWSVALYDGEGRLIDNAADRHAFSSKTVLPGGDGAARIALAPTPRAGYWLPTGEGRNLMLVFRVFRPFETADIASGEMPVEILPSVERVDCA